MLNRQQKSKNDFNLFLNNYFNVLMVVFVILILAFSYALILKPKFNRTMNAIEENIEQQQLLYSSQQRKLNSLKLVSELYGKINESDLERFNSVLPNEYIQERLFGEVEEIISDSGFVLNTVQIATRDLEEEVSSQTVREIEMTLSLSTIDYVGFKNLLRILEKNLRLFDIDEVDFSPSGNAATIRLTTYYYKNK